MNQSLTSSSTFEPNDPSKGYSGMSDEEEMRRASMDTNGIGEVLVDLNENDLRELGIE